MDNILLKALEFICEMNYKQAEDQYGDRSKAKSWSCVKVAETAIAEWQAKQSNQLDGKEQILEVIKAWESLPGNTHYSPKQISDWLLFKMHPVIEKLRNFISTTKEITNEKTT